MNERIPPIEPPFPEEIADDLAAMMPPGVPPLALFRALAHNPRVLRKIRAGNLLDRGSLERRDRELVILRTCARCGSEYEWGVHAAVFARRVGLDEAEIEGSVHASWWDGRWSSADRSLVRLVDELHDTSRVSDDLWSELRAHWRDDQIVELLVLVGFYHTIAFVTNGLELELEPAAERFPAAPAA